MRPKRTDYENTWQSVRNAAKRSKSITRLWMGMIPELTPDLKEEPSLDPSFSQEKAEASFQKRLAEEKEREQNGVEAGASLSPLAVRRGPSLRKYLHRYEIWIPLVASAVLCATFGILSYRTGRNHGIEWAHLEQRNKPGVEAALATAPPQTNTKLDDVELATRDAALADLRREIAQKTSELEKIKALASSQQLALRASTEDKNGVTGERDRLLQQVSADEEALASDPSASPDSRTGTLGVCDPHGQS